MEFACNKRWMICLSAVLTVAFLGLCAFAEGESLPAKDKVVVVEGFSPLTEDAGAGSVRHAALADALRRAVEKAAGVLVTSETHTKNFVLTRDTISTSSEGFVKEYRILNEQQIGGLYRIKIEATVAPGSPVRPLEFICKALRDGPNPLFKISVDGRSGRTISGELARLGLRATADADAPSIEIRGSVKPESRGEAAAGSEIYASGGSTDLSVIDCASGTVLPCLDVVLSQPIASTSQSEADRMAEDTASKLWVQRNVPLIAAAILGPDRFKLDGAEISKSAVEKPTTPEAAIIDDSVATPPMPDDYVGELAWKLSNDVKHEHDFSRTPVTVAVSKFKSINMNDDSQAENLLEDLQTAMAKTGVFELVERNQLDRVLRELKIQNSGLIDSATAKRLGKLTGADAVLVGSISDRKDCIVINVRLINTETGRVRIAESETVEKDAEPVVLEAGPRR
jgi:TolB-like protein